MSTDDATLTLARIYLVGPYDGAEYDAEPHLMAALRAGRDWRWLDAECAIRAAYRALGAEPADGTGYAWHCGRHPLSHAIAAERERIFGDAA
jgi:hypothetical protein